MQRLWDSLESTLRFVVAIPLSLMPRRLWPDLETHAPVGRAAALSGVLTIFLAAAIGIPAYLDFVQQSSSEMIDRVLESTGWRPPRNASAPISQGAAQAGWLATFFNPLIFALSPIGLLSVYLGLSGWFRAISVAFDDARGDPILTVIDRVLFRSRIKRNATRARQDRERLEGVEVADRVLSGAQAGIPDAEIVVVASRQKPDWVKGTFIITEEKWYRLEHPVERQTPNGLRTLYPLTEVRDQEVLRKGIRYDLHGKG